MTNLKYSNVASILPAQAENRVCKKLDIKREHSFEGAKQTHNHEVRSVVLTNKHIQIDDEWPSQRRGTTA